MSKAEAEPMVMRASKLPSEDWIAVPETLPPDVHPIDQPPYTWAREDFEHKYPDFFLKANGWYPFAGRTLANPSPLSIYSYDVARFRKALRIHQYIDLSLYDYDEIFSLGNQLRDELKNTYPYSLDYLIKYGADFTWTLEPKSIHKMQLSIPTYSAFAYEWYRKTTTGIHSEIWGIEEILLDELSLSDADKVAQAIPPVRAINRAFRFRKAILKDQ